MSCGVIQNQRPKMALTNSLARFTRDFGFYGFAAEQNGFT